MFTSDQRDAVRTRLLELAEQDPRITGAAVTGSAADGREDRWSDVDLFFGVADHLALDAVVADWSAYLYGELGALHHFELTVPGAVYRAFLLPSCLEVDLGFTPAGRFGPVGPHFRAVFGEAAQPPPATPPDPGHRIGLAWHHVLHARSCIERHQPWQAEYWISGIRDQALALACLRFGKPTDYAKGADALPPAVTGGLEDALVRSLAPEELRRALRVAATRLIPELYATDPNQAHRLEGPIRELADVAGGQAPEPNRTNQGGGRVPGRVEVRCYAGGRGEETPRAVLLGGREVAVRVERRWIEEPVGSGGTGRRRVFQVRLEDGRRCRLAREPDGAWTLAWMPS